MNEVEKLKQAARWIEELTEGRQRLLNSPSGTLAVQTDGRAFFALGMQSRYLPASKCCEIVFVISIQRKEQAMDAAKMECLLTEAQQMQDLLLELGRQEYCPTLAELSEFQEYLTQYPEHQQQPGPVPGQTF